MTPRRPSGAVKFEPATCNGKIARYAETPGRRRRPSRAPIGPRCAITAVSVEVTCPDSCELKGIVGAPGGCYFRAGFTGIMSQRLDRAARGFSSQEIIEEEARQISGAFRGKQVPQDGRRGGRDLRLHVGGDVQTAKEAGLLGEAAADWKRRGGGAVFTFTESWRNVSRAAWGPDVSVLGSVSDPADIERAAGQGYAAAIKLEAFRAKGKTFTLAGADGWRITPCPAQTSDRVCVECRLCMNGDALLRRRAAIGFEVHGPHREHALQALTRVRLRVLSQLPEVNTNRGSGSRGEVKHPA